MVRDQHSTLALPNEAFSIVVDRQAPGALTPSSFSPVSIANVAPVTTLSFLGLGNHGQHPAIPSAESFSPVSQSGSASDTPVYSRADRRAWVSLWDNSSDGYSRGSSADSTYSAHPERLPAINFAYQPTFARRYVSEVSDPSMSLVVARPAPAVDLDDGTPRSHHSTGTVTYSPELIDYWNSHYAQVQGGVQARNGRNRMAPAIYKVRTSYVVRPPREVRCPSGDGGARSFWLENGMCAPNLSTLRSQRQSKIGAATMHDACAICLEPISVGELVQPMVRCSHIFHHECINAMLNKRWTEDMADQDEWRLPLGDRVLCPLCRAPLAAASLSEIPELERDLVSALAPAERAKASQIRIEEVVKIGRSATMGNTNYTCGGGAAPIMRRAATTNFGGTQASGGESGRLGNHAVLMRSHTTNFAASSSLSGSVDGLGASGEGSRATLSRQPTSIVTFDSD